VERERAAELFDGQQAEGFRAGLRPGSGGAALGIKDIRQSRDLHA
jgi:hypothetical protein